MPIAFTLIYLDTIAEVCLGSEVSCVQIINTIANIQNKIILDPPPLINLYL